MQAGSEYFRETSVRMPVKFEEEEGYRVVLTTDKGFALFARKLFKSGETIFEEKPFVSSQFVWNSTCKYPACDHCMRPLESATTNARRLAGADVNNINVLPYENLCLTKEYSVEPTKCKQCEIVYCSEICRNEAYNQYHMVICLKNYYNDPLHPMNELKEIWKTLHYPPETTTIMLFTRILGGYMQSNNKIEYLECIKQFQNLICNETLWLKHKILSANFNEQLTVLYSYYVKVFEKFSDIEMFLTPEAFRNIFAIIAINGQGIGTSSFGYWVQKITDLKNLSEDEEAKLKALIDEIYVKLDNVSGLEFLNVEGSGLYLKQSKINHSCEPNAEIIFPYCNHIIAIKTLRDIQPNEEICISYIDNCMLNSSRHTRQKILQENYLFECKCSKCNQQINDPDVTSDDEEDDDDEDEDEDDGENMDTN